MLDVDLDAFWRDDAIAHRDNCFFPGTQVALGIRMSDECVFSELGVAGTPWAPIPRDMRLEYNKRYNDKAERIVGRRLLREELPPEDAAFPAVKRIGEVFGGRYAYHNDTEWLYPATDDPGELEKILARVENMDFRAFLLPPNWEAEKKRIFETYGLRPPRLRHMRGPVTLACSIFGAENLIFLLQDEPELAARFSRAITHAAIGMARVMDEESGDFSGGFSFADDNCCLLSPALYESFGYPVLRAVFAALAPGENDLRYQHSDSAMGHLLPILGRLNLNGVNFGPTVLIPEIRRYLPRARIDGCIAPFTFMRNDLAQLVRETRRDCVDGLRYGGVNITTAGSINDGSSLESMRAVMATIQKYPRKM